MMKLTKKIGIGLTVTVLALSPLLPNLNPVQTVQAAKKKAKAKGTISLLRNDYVYDKFGHKIKIKQEHGTGGYLVPRDFSVDPKGFAITDADTEVGEMANSYSYYGIRKIKGQKYYRLAHSYYLNEAVVSTENKRNIKKKKLVLNHDSLVYTKNGQATGKKLAKNTIVKYQGNIKSAKMAPKYFFYENDWARHFQVKYLPTHKINKKQYYFLGRNRYINAANVSYIDGHIARYNGVVTATVLEKTFTFPVNLVPYKRTLKKGQKIKVDLTVIPYANDGFEGYIFRLHDHPDEYVNQNSISLKRDLPIVNYEDLIYTYVQPLSGNSVELYDTSGTAIGKKMKKPKYSDITVDGLMYLWVPSENKAQLFYHCLNYTNETIIDDKQPIVPNADQTTSRQQNEKLLYGNNFIKVSDVKYTSGIKLKLINSAKQAESDQKVASEADKQELLKLFDDGKEKYGRSAYDELMANYECALTNASLILKNNKATVAQVKEAVWYLKTTITQFTTMSYPLGD